MLLHLMELGQCFHTRFQMVQRDLLVLHHVTFIETEKRYSQLEKEGLACVFGLTRFHSYFFGHRFTLVTEHKPLTLLFGGNYPISLQASGQI